MAVRLPALLLAVALALMAPVAAAFPGATQAVDISYDPSSGPTALMTGELEFSGVSFGALLVVDSIGSRFGPIARVDVLTGSSERDMRLDSYENVTLVLHAGSALVVPNATSGVGFSLRTGYGLGIGIAEAPFDASMLDGMMADMRGNDTQGGAASEGEAAAPTPGFLMASEDAFGPLSFGNGSADLLLVDAVVSIQTPDGSPVDGWDHREVNPTPQPGGPHQGAQPGDGADAADFVAPLRLAGPFEGELHAHLVGSSLGEEGAVTVVAGPAAEPRFRQVLDVFRDMGPVGAMMNGVGADAIARAEPLAPFLNGAIVLVHMPGPNGTASVVGRIGDNDVDLGPFALLRGDGMQVAWGAEEMRVQGDASFAMSGEGVAVRAPAALGPLPLVSVLLWLTAAAALVWYFVRRPPQTDEKFWTLRLASLGVHVAVFLLVFWWWDAQFAETFGTSFLTRLSSGATADDAGILLLVFGIQMFPWALAALLFALPVRIALGVALRYLGRGKAFRGVAKAGGLLVLAVLGPYFALWLLDTAIARAMSAFPAFG